MIFNVNRVEWDNMCSKKETLSSFEESVRANDAIVGAVYNEEYSTIENVVKTKLEG